MILETTFDLKFIGVLAIVLSLITGHKNYISMHLKKCISPRIERGENPTFLFNIMRSHLAFFKMLSLKKNNKKKNFFRHNTKEKHVVNHFYFFPKISTEKQPSLRFGFL